MEHDFDYRGTTLRNNYIDAFGSRIHIAFPMGPGVWVPNNKDKVLVGETVCGNTVTGGEAAFGFIVNGVDDFNVYDNKSTANYSGIAEGLRQQALTSRVRLFMTVREWETLNFKRNSCPASITFCTY